MAVRINSAYDAARYGKSKITSYFGTRTDPLSESGSVQTRKGIDIAAVNGTEIYAAAGGVVTRAGDYNDGYGNCVYIQHDNSYTSRYAHCESINVEVGDNVKIGQTIATVGSTGKSTGNHLHFEIRDENKNALNPLDYVEYKTK